MKPIDSTERMCVRASTTGPAICVCGRPPSGCSFSRTRFRSRHATIARTRNATANAVQKTDRANMDPGTSCLGRRFHGAQSYLKVDKQRKKRTNCKNATKGRDSQGREKADGK